MPARRPAVPRLLRGQRPVLYIRKRCSGTEMDALRHRALRDNLPCRHGLSRKELRRQPRKILRLRQPGTAREEEEEEEDSRNPAQPHHIFQRNRRAPSAEGGMLTLFALGYKAGACLLCDLIRGFY